MSRTTISTGKMTLDATAEQRRPESSSETSGLTTSKNGHCHILLLGDFSGRGQRGLNNVGTIKSRKIIEIDRGNFDEVFAQLDVRCRLPLAGELRFAELDDLHPDFLYEQVALFQQFKSLHKKLKSPQSFAAAAEEIHYWHSHRHSESFSDKHSDRQPRQQDSNHTPTDASEGGASLLDSVLSGSEIPATDGLDLQAMIKDMVAPYVTPKPDPQQQELLETVDQAASELMRKLLHHPHLQTLEAAWRSLYLLVRRIETDSKLKLFVLDISQQELMDDAAGSESAEQMQLYQRLIEQHSAQGAKTFSVITVDATFGVHQEDIQTLAKLGEVAAAAHALLVTGGSTRLAGCEDLGITPAHEDWHFCPSPDVTAAWQQLRKSPQAAQIVAVAPRYLARLPYGKKSAPIEAFRFEELPAREPHRFYLWSNGAWLVTYILAQGFSMSGDLSRQQVFEIDRLPLHVFQLDGETQVTPCAETTLLDSAAKALREQGLTVIRSILNKDAVSLPQIHTLAH